MGSVEERKKERKKERGYMGTVKERKGRGYVRRVKGRKGVYGNGKRKEGGIWER